MGPSTKKVDVFSFPYRGSAQAHPRKRTPAPFREGSKRGAFLEPYTDQVRKYIGPLCTTLWSQGFATRSFLETTLLARSLKSRRGVVSTFRVCTGRSPESGPRARLWGSSCPAFLYRNHNSSTFSCPGPFWAQAAKVRKSKAQSDQKYAPK